MISLLALALLGDEPATQEVRLGRFAMAKRTTELELDGKKAGVSITRGYAYLIGESKRKGYVAVVGNGDEATFEEVSATPWASKFEVKESVIARLPIAWVKRSQAGETPWEYTWQDIGSDYGGIKLGAAPTYGTWDRAFEWWQTYADMGLNSEEIAANKSFMTLSKGKFKINNGPSSTSGKTTYNDDTGVLRLHWNDGVRWRGRFYKDGSALYLELSTDKDTVLRFKKRS